MSKMFNRFMIPVFQENRLASIGQEHKRKNKHSRLPAKCVVVIAIFELIINLPHISKIRGVRCTPVLFTMLLLHADMGIPLFYFQIISFLASQIFDFMLLPVAFCDRAQSIFVI